MVRDPLLGDPTARPGSRAHKEDGPSSTSLSEYSSSDMLRKRGLRAAGPAFWRAQAQPGKFKPSAAPTRLFARLLYSAAIVRNLKATAVSARHALSGARHLAGPRPTPGRLQPVSRAPPCRIGVDQACESRALGLALTAPPPPPPPPPPPAQAAAWDGVLLGPRVVEPWATPCLARSWTWSSSWTTPTWVSACFQPRVCFCTADACRCLAAAHASHYTRCNCARRDAGGGPGGRPIQ